jgi:hypothetical protein
MPAQSVWLVMLELLLLLLQNPETGREEVREYKENDFIVIPARWVREMCGAGQAGRLGRLTGRLAGWLAGWLQDAPHVRIPRGQLPAGVVGRGVQGLVGSFRGCGGRIFSTKIVLP